LSCYTLLNIIGLFLNVVGAFFFSLAFILRIKTIKKISSTKWGRNPDVEKWLIKSRREGIFGLIFLSMGFLIQAIVQFVH